MRGPAKSLRPPATADASEVYEMLLRALLPARLRVTASCIEVFAKAPERFDPLSIGLQERERIVDLNRLGLASALATVCRTNVAITDPEISKPKYVGQELSTDGGDGVLRIYLGPLEQTGPDEITVEAGVSPSASVEQHGVWRLNRYEGQWRVERCELLWQSLQCSDSLPRKRRAKGSGMPPAST